mgnify:FL=1
MPTEELLRFTGTLSTRYWEWLTEADFIKIGEFVASDGCSGVPDFYLNGCIIHDFYYRTHRNLDGSPITKKEADLVLREYDHQHSVLSHASIIGNLWYLGVRWFGRKAWE